MACDEPRATGNVRVCLESEQAFLFHLLQTDEFAGFRPSELVDVYQYAKSTFRDHSERTRNDEERYLLAIRILDEIGQWLFGTCRVTSRRGSEDWLLLTSQEGRLLNAWIGDPHGDDEPIVLTGGGEAYALKIRELGMNLATLAADVRQGAGDSAVYEKDVDCRSAFTRLALGVLFWWKESNAAVLLLFEESEPLSPDPDTGRLQAAFLHAVARFALSPKSRQEMHSSTMSQYDLPAIPEKWLDDRSDASFGNLQPFLPLNSPEQDGFVLPYEGAPSAVRLSAHLIVRLQNELREHFSEHLPATEEMPVELLFFCKDGDAAGLSNGWMWLFSRKQRESLWRTYQQSGGDAAFADRQQEFEAALREFRFGTTGIVNHLERSRRMVEEVVDYQLEPYTCFGDAYTLEASPEIIDIFTRIEGAIPNDRCYYFARLSPKLDQPPGSLVAVIGVPRKIKRDPASRAALFLRISSLLIRWRAQVEVLDSARDDVVALEAEKKKAVTETAQSASRAAIMSRNLSHNIGSHSLANPRLHSAIGLEKLEERLQKGAGKPCESCSTHARDQLFARIKTGLSTFHQFTQARLDFVARALNQQEERPEPLFLLNDVLNGLLRQGVLLDTLLSDRGFPIVEGSQRTRPIRLFLHVPESSDFIVGNEVVSCFAYDTATGNFELDTAHPDGAPQDILLGLPGGVTGSQALYSLLENVMRNAAKYGRHTENASDLQLHLRLRHARHCEVTSRERYRTVEIWENLSDDPDSAVAMQLRHYLRQSLIDTEGKPISEGHGVQEMKIAAEFVSGRQTMIDDDKLPECDCDYCTFVRDNSSKGFSGLNAPFPILRDGHLRCFNRYTKHDEKEITELVYQFVVPRPRLMGIVGSRPPSAEISAESEFVAFHDSLESLGEAGAAFGVVIHHSNLSVSESLNRIATLHASLPYRLIVLADTEADLESWRLEMSAMESARFTNPASAALPVRRVKLIADSDLYRYFSQGRMDKLVSMSAPETACIRLFRAWLRAYKPVPSPYTRWDLLIGFERSWDQIAARWQVPRSTFERNEGAPFINLHLAGSSGDGATISVGSNVDTSFARPNMIVFDNHGNVFKQLRWIADSDTAVRVYHPFSGNETSLFQSLETPPQTAFSFAWFLYSLVEGALTNVLVLDERVAESTVTAGQIFSEAHRRFLGAGIYPIFSIRSNGLAGDVHAVSPRVGDAVKVADILVDGQDEGQSIAPWEGLFLDTPAAKVSVATWRLDPATGNSLQIVKDIQPDVVILHEGIIDLMPNWRYRTELKLFAITPRVIRTSGRGPKARRLDSRLPFLEFSELSGTTYRGLNKPALVRSCFSVSGIS